MSWISRLTFGVSLAVSGSIIAYVHIKQATDREKLYEGVIKDIERINHRKLDSIQKPHKQNDLYKQLNPGDKVV